MNTDLERAERALDTLANKISDRQRRTERLRGALSEKRRELAGLLGVPAKTPISKLLPKAKTKITQLRSGLSEEMEQLKASVEALEELIGND